MQWIRKRLLCVHFSAFSQGEYFSVEHFKTCTFATPLTIIAQARSLHYHTPEYGHKSRRCSVYGAEAGSAEELSCVKKTASHGLSAHSCAANTSLTSSPGVVISFSPEGTQQQSPHTSITSVIPELVASNRWREALAALCGLDPVASLQSLRHHMEEIITQLLWQGHGSGALMVWQHVYSQSLLCREEMDFLSPALIFQLALFILVVDGQPSSALDLLLLSTSYVTAEHTSQLPCTPEGGEHDPMKLASLLGTDVEKDNVKTRCQIVEGWLQCMGQLALLFSPRLDESSDAKTGALGHPTERRRSEGNVRSERAWKACVAVMEQLTSQILKTPQASGVMPKSGSSAYFPLAAPLLLAFHLLGSMYEVHWSVLNQADPLGGDSHKSSGRNSCNTIAIAEALRQHLPTFCSLQAWELLICGVLVPTVQAWRFALTGTQELHLTAAEVSGGLAPVSDSQELSPSWDVNRINQGKLATEAAGKWFEQVRECLLTSALVHQGPSQRTEDRLQLMLLLLQLPMCTDLVRTCQSRDRGTSLFPSHHGDKGEHRLRQYRVLARHVEVFVKGGCKGAAASSASSVIAEEWSGADLTLASHLMYLWGGRSGSVLGGEKRHPLVNALKDGGERLFPSLCNTFIAVLLRTPIPAFTQREDPLTQEAACTMEPGQARQWEAAVIAMAVAVAQWALHTGSSCHPPRAVPAQQHHKSHGALPWSRPLEGSTNLRSAPASASPLIPLQFHTMFVKTLMHELLQCASAQLDLLFFAQPAAPAMGKTDAREPFPPRLSTQEWRYFVESFLIPHGPLCVEPYRWRRSLDGGVPRARGVEPQSRLRLPALTIARLLRRWWLPQCFRGALDEADPSDCIYEMHMSCNEQALVSALLHRHYAATRNVDLSGSGAVPLRLARWSWFIEAVQELWDGLSRPLGDIAAGAHEVHGSVISAHNTFTDPSRNVLDEMGEALQLVSNCSDIIGALHNVLSCCKEHNRSDVAHDLVKVLCLSVPQFFFAVEPTSFLNSSSDASCDTEQKDGLLLALLLRLSYEALRIQNGQLQRVAKALKEGSSPPPIKHMKVCERCRELEVNLRWLQKALLRDICQWHPNFFTSFTHLHRFVNDIGDGARTLSEQIHDLLTIVVRALCEQDFRLDDVSHLERVRHATQLELHYLQEPTSVSSNSFTLHSLTLVRLNVLGVALRRTGQVELYSDLVWKLAQMGPRVFRHALQTATWKYRSLWSAFAVNYVLTVWAWGHNSWKGTIAATAKHSDQIEYRRRMKLVRTILLDRTAGEGDTNVSCMSEPQQQIFLGPDVLAWMLPAECEALRLLLALYVTHHLSHESCTPVRDRIEAAAQRMMRCLGNCCAGNPILVARILEDLCGLSTPQIQRKGKKGNGSSIAPARWLQIYAPLATQVVLGDTPLHTALVESAPKLALVHLQALPTAFAAAGETRDGEITSRPEVPAQAQARPSMLGVNAFIDEGNWVAALRMIPRVLFHPLHMVRKALLACERARPGPGVAWVAALAIWRYATVARLRDDTRQSSVGTGRRHAVGKGEIGRIVTVLAHAHRWSEALALFQQLAPSQLDGYIFSQVAYAFRSSAGARRAASIRGSNLNDMVMCLWAKWRCRVGDEVRPTTGMVEQLLASGLYGTSEAAKCACLLVKEAVSQQQSSSQSAKPVSDPAIEANFIRGAEVPLDFEKNMAALQRLLTDRWYGESWQSALALAISSGHPALIKVMARQSPLHSGIFEAVLANSSGHTQRQGSQNKEEAWKNNMETAVALAGHAVSQSRFATVDTAPPTDIMSPRQANAVAFRQETRHVEHILNGLLGKE